MNGKYCSVERVPIYNDVPFCNNKIQTDFVNEFVVVYALDKVNLQNEMFHF